MSLGTVFAGFLWHILGPSCKAPPARGSYFNFKESGLI